MTDDEYVKKELYNFLGQTDYLTKKVIKELKKRRKMPRKTKSLKNLQPFWQNYWQKKVKNER